MKRRNGTNGLILACAILLAGNLIANLRAKPAAEAPRTVVKHNIVFSSNVVGLRDQLDKWSADGWRTSGFSYNGSQYIAVLEK